MASNHGPELSPGKQRPNGGAEATPGAQSYAWLRDYPKHANWHTAYKAAPLFHLLDDAAAHYGTRPCTTFLGRVTTYGEIWNQVNQVAAGLQRIGVSKGTKVGLFLPNCPAFIVYYYAILKVGGVVVNYNPLYSVEEVTYQVRDSDTEIMVTLDLKVLFNKVDALLSDGVLKQAVVVPFASMLPFPKSWLFPIAKRGDVASVGSSKNTAKIVRHSDLWVATSYTPIAVSIDPETDLAVLQYTGGTTGTPKGAMLTHANCYINTLQVIDWANDLEQAGERVLGVLPFFHVFAMTVVMNFGIAKAAEIIIMPRFELNGALDLIKAHKPTIMPGVPTLFNAIANSSRVKDIDMTSLKFCLSGGAPLLLDIKQNFERITGCTLVEGYGLSETSPVATCNPTDGRILPGSIGMPIPATILTLRDPSDPTKEVPIGERGEICIGGPQVMKGYWKRPAETAQQFVGPYFRTGDIGVMDANGFFTIVDRIKDLIICSGYNVYPRRIEEAIAEHAAVEEVTVIGIPDTYRGEAPKAFVKLKSGMTASSDDIMRHLATKIAKIEWPSDIEFRDTLPKTMIGKLSKKELKEEEAKKRAQQSKL
jgi:long-chain acyl-CoA synthetase